MKYLIIDWFEIFVEEPAGFSMDSYREADCTVEARDYGTRVYQEVATVHDHQLGFSFEVRRVPKSNGVLAVGSCHLKMCNDVCYMMNPAEAAYLVCCKYRLSYKSVARVDVCTDFLKFDSGITPLSFLKRVLNGVYRRSISGLRKDVVQENWGSVSPNYVAWHSNDIFVRLYDKTLELRQVASPSKRAYISALWVSHGLLKSAHEIYDDSISHVWRLEFQIMSSSKDWVKIDKSGYFLNSLDTWSSSSESFELFRSLLASYFTFYVFKRGSDISSCERVRLFDCERGAVRITRVVSNEVHQASFKLRLLALIADIDKYKSDASFARLKSSLEAIRCEAERLLRSESDLTDDDIYAMRDKISSIHSDSLPIPFGL